MNLEALEKDICYVIKEEQIKLGFRKESISFYYPLSSLNSILETKCNTEKMLQALDEFKIKSKAEFGDIDVSVKGERFCIKLPDTASEYVNNTTEKTGFLYDLIATVLRHGITIEDVKRYLKAIPHMFILKPWSMKNLIILFILRTECLMTVIIVLQKRADTLFTTVFQKMPIKIRLTDNGDSKNV